MERTTKSSVDVPVDAAIAAAITAISSVLSCCAAGTSCTVSFTAVSVCPAFFLLSRYGKILKQEITKLIGKNKEHFGLENIEIIKADAPDGLETLLKPTHAFIGGSSRRMNEILSVLYQKNPKMRIVINAISLETICEIKEVLSDYPIENEELIQLQVSRARVAGSYHLMQAENQVWICAFDFCG